MKKNLISLLLISLAAVFLGEIQAQVRKEVRSEDHFFRRRVVNRLDLGEKINQPLVQRQSGIYTTSQDASHQGLIAALMDGLKQGTYSAYEPDDLNQPMNYEEVLARMQEYEQAIDPGFELSEEPLISPESEFYTDDWISPAPENLQDEQDMVGEAAADYGPYESVIQFVEDRIFDKKASEMVYHIDFFQVIWTDPGETLPEKYLACFRYEDIQEVLEKTLWLNRFNDAESRTFAEIFDMRLFNSYLTNVSGTGIRSLPEAEHRRQELLEFEHHLWNY